MKRKMIYLLVLTLLINGGCRKFVEVGLPKNLLLKEAVFANDGQAIAALTNIYGQFTSTSRMGYYIPFYLGTAADELTGYSSNSVAVQFYQNAPQPLNSSSNTLWETFYNIIYQANAVLEGCEQSTGITASVKKQVMAEAKFVRAFAYFYLVNLWGDVPLLLNTDYQSNAVASRSSIANVYTQIITDLEAAAEDLNPNYVDASSTYKPTYTERVRPNQSSARALLARIYLYNSNWIKAEENANAVISNTAQYEIVSLASAFLKNNREAIWQLMTSSNASTLATYEGLFFILTAKPGIQQSNSSALSPQLLAALSLSDLRRNNWTSSYTDRAVTPNVTYYFPYKYKDRTSTSYLEYSTPLRLAEQYLIRAEARLEQNNTEGAREDLNKVRARTGLGNTTAVTPVEIKAAILKERQVELFAEWGHRWLDLKRTNQIDAVMSTVTPAKGGAAWNSNMKYFPIPQKDIEANGNLKQNPGYN